MNDLITLSNALFVATLFVYIVAMAAFFGHLTWANRFTGVLAVGITVLGLATHLGSIVARSAAAGRAPWGNMYEFSVSGAFVMVALFLTAVYTKYRVPLLGGAVLLAAVIILGVGWILAPPTTDLVPALRSRWLTFHVFLAMSGSGVLGLAAILSGGYLLRLRWEDRNLVRAPDGATSLGRGHRDRDDAVDLALGGFGGVAAKPGPASLVGSSSYAGRRAADALSQAVAGRRQGPGAALAVPARRGLFGRLPAADKLDLVAYRIIMIGFPVWTMAIIAGSIWGEQAWGRYWGWDPKETWSFVVWVIFAGYLHARATAGWKGRRAAWLAIAGGTALAVNFYAVNLWIVGLHSYA